MTESRIIPLPDRLREYAESVATWGSGDDPELEHAVEWRELERDLRAAANKLDAAAHDLRRVVAEIEGETEG